MKNKEQLIKRVKSLLWRTGGMAFVTFLTWLISPETIDALAEAGVAVPALVTTIAGLVAGEVTKSLNKSEDISK